MLADKLKADLRAALLTATIEVTVGLLANLFLVKMKPFPDSDKLVKDKMEELQPRPNTPPVQVGWKGDGGAPEWIGKLNQED